VTVIGGRWMPAATQLEYLDEAGSAGEGTAARSRSSIVRRFVGEGSSPDVGVVRERICKETSSEELVVPTHHKAPGVGETRNIRQSPFRPPTVCVVSSVLVIELG